ncbi:hypothetical protein D3C86_1815290 [compost metagenome]
MSVKKEIQCNHHDCKGGPGNPDPFSGLLYRIFIERIDLVNRRVGIQQRDQHSDQQESGKDEKGKYQVMGPEWIFIWRKDP